VKSRLLDTLELPHQLRSLSIGELEQLAAELRDELIDTVSASGGHFASSLGATEITVALHHVFNTPHDRLIWDVGHQAYIHKMLTGRREQMASIRTKNGVSGFLKRSESPFDAFGAGHAGTSISAAVGMRIGLDRSAKHGGGAAAAAPESAPAEAAVGAGESERFVVPVIGDGSLTSGMVFEALNHAGDLGLKRFIVVLNDNEMSISPNVGALSWLFSRAVTGATGSRARTKVKELYRRGYVPEVLYRALDRAEEATQGFFSSPAMLFEAFGFRYIGPIDGHSMPDLVQALRNATLQDIPVIVHCHTTKGKGYEPAEEDPIVWHGVTPFDRSKGEFKSPASPPPKKVPSYTAVFAETLTELARADSKIVAITAAMLSGTGLDKMALELPEQVFDVGICEQHAVTYAAGLACEGLRPVAAIYSTFLQRAYDQVIHDVCIQRLPVVFAIDRGGVVGNDGETHQGVFDIAYLRTVPEITIMSPKDENELRHMLFTATRSDSGCPGAVALRYPRGNGVGVPLDPTLCEVPIGVGEVLRRGTQVAFICFGPIVQTALKAAAVLEAEDGVSCTVINARFAKPLDRALLHAEVPRHDLVCTVEDHAIDGGFGSAVLECINDDQIAVRHPVVRLGVQDNFVPHATQAEQHQLNGYDVAGLVATVRTHYAAQPAHTHPREVPQGRVVPV
jgi:1-deoxy-D-xylulose-5-phosphate synthase